ncbi:hypothetical protein WHR41_04353 [Cladosporium halotolerans]|uniref:Integral membrane protein n=1 Tax=Cladosporium halotolerans TaxID=1052096 RepID=A0AB34KSW3_9PEZI
MQTSRATILASAALLLGSLPPIAAHGDEHSQGEHGHEAAMKPEIADFPPNYFRHPEYAGWMYAHIALLIIAWVVVLPPAIMLSVARSRYHLPAQVGFHVLNGLGLFTGFVYNQSTPDLYVTNSHHPAGWAITAISIVWTILSFATAFAAPRKQRHGQDSSVFQQHVGTEDAYQQYVDSPASYRFSSDSGNFSAGSRANSSDSIYNKDEHIPNDEHDHEDDVSAESRGFLGNGRVQRSLSSFTTRVSGTRVSAALRFGQIVLEKLLLILGFLGITTGFVVYGGLFQNREVFSGLAHYIKGGIFFWYGLLTLGRWMGAFAEFGWAWNIRPSQPLVARWKTMVPSAEFTESFVIWLYGASNVFLEHMNNWGGEWSPQDFEHVSITILFFGGGLLGMIIESRLVRDLTSATVELQKSEDPNTLDDAGFKDISGYSPAQEGGHKRWERPATYSLSLNPMPALTIMFLGMMMSGHHQNSMVSTMMHAQWGMLFTGFAMTRAVTYLMLYIKPPTSHFPSRPPSDLVAAFCLTAGGILFMNSAHDSVTAIEVNGLDAMTIFTITIGLTGIIMAWELICFTIKGWAATKEHRATRS